MKKTGCLKLFLIVIIVGVAIGVIGSITALKMGHGKPTGSNDQFATVTNTS